jgi:hypothetical protein
MGRRSRKRSIDEQIAPAPSPAPAARPAPAALRRRATADERPPAPWGSFPLGELTTLAGLVLLILAFVQKSEQMLAVGLALVCLSAAELAAREHFAGFRSHSALLGLILGAVTVVVLVIAGTPRIVQIAGGVAAFAAAFFWMRRLFMDKTGGMGFRA